MHLFEGLYKKPLNSIEEFRITLLEKVHDDRLALNYAIAAATALGLLKHFDLSQQDIHDFRQWVIEEAIHNRELKESESFINEFWNTIAVLHTREELSGADYWSVEDKRIYVWSAGLYHLFETDYRRRKGESPFKYNVLLQYMIEEGYVVDTACRKRLNGKRRRCFVLDRQQAPEAILSIVESQ